MVLSAGISSWIAQAWQLSDVLSIGPRHCARLTYFFHPKSRKINAVLITLKLITLTIAAPAAHRSVPISHRSPVRGS